MSHGLVKQCPRVIAAAALLVFSARVMPAYDDRLHPQITQVIGDVSEARIGAILEKLVGFGTRHTLSNTDSPDHGIGAARQWIFDELQSYSPRLQVRFDKWRVKPRGRIAKEVDLYNVVAVLPGKTMPETQIVISAHYDSLGGNDPELPAPGASDDGSGTAAVMELARVLSHYEFDKTLVFMAFAGEEEGLIGSTLEAAKAKKDGALIEAVLNNDIIGTDKAGNGRTDASAVSVYGGSVMDAPSQELARYAHEIGERYMPGMKVTPIFMQDRIGRGGDHAPFQAEGFAAVRVSTPNEIYANEHHATDTLENMSVPYTTKVAKMNAAVAASLAMAPKAPVTPAQLTRGAGYDAVLKWQAAGPDSTIGGYAIVVRATTSPLWEQEIYVGKVTQFTFKDLSIDDVRFGVKAIGPDGSESLASTYRIPQRSKIEIQTVEQ
jgi:hypothetical protein